MATATLNVKLSEASRDEMLVFAQQNLGIDLPRNISADQCRAKIKAAWDKDTFPVTVTVGDAAEAPEAPAPFAAPAPPAADNDAERLVSAGGGRDPVVMLILYESERPGGKRDVFVGVNGIGMTIPRGRKVPVPYRYYHIIANAVEDVVTEDEETHELITNQVPRYPHQVVEMPPQAEIDAWLARTQDKFAA